MANPTRLDLAALERDDTVQALLRQPVAAQVAHWPCLLAQGEAVRQGQFNAAALLWTDPTLQQVPHANAARVLVLLRAVLQREQLLAGREQGFLNQYAGWATVSPAPGGWATPLTYCWTRLAFALLGTSLTGQPLTPLAAGYARALGQADPRACLALHLERLRDLAQAARLPTTGPVARHEGYALPLDPQTLFVPGLEVAEAPCRAGLAYQAEHVGLLEQTLAQLARYAPESFAHFRRSIRLAALKPRGWGGYDDFSEPALPGTFFASVVPNPLELAAHLLHEHQHNRLAFIEEFGPLFDATRGDPVGDTNYYSPWRDKPRALYGLYHGVYVFIAVARYWLRVYTVGNVTGGDRAYVIDRLLRLPRQLQLGVGLLQRFARLTPLGQVLLEQFCKDVAALCRHIGQTDLPADVPALKVAEDGSYVPDLGQSEGRPLTVLGALREHLQRNDPHGQCAGLVADLR